MQVNVLFSNLISLMWPKTHNDYDSGNNVKQDQSS